jgi:hypothetical protein
VDKDFSVFSEIMVSIVDPFQYEGILLLTFNNNLPWGFY